MSVSLFFTLFIYKALHLKLTLYSLVMLPAKMSILWVIYTTIVSLKLYISYLLIRWLLCRKQMTDYLFNLGINYLTPSVDFSCQATELQWGPSPKQNLQKLSPFSDLESALSGGPSYTPQISTVLALIDYTKVYFAVHFGAVNYGLAELDNVVTPGKQTNAFEVYSNSLYSIGVRKPLQSASLMEITVLPDFYWVVYNRRLNN